jgi:integrase
MVGKSKTEHGAGRSVPMNRRAITTLEEWSAQFPDRKPAHYVFPSERVGFSGNNEVPEVFDTDPAKPITSWKTAWKTAKTAAGVECRFHDLRHTTCTRLLERAAPFAAVAAIMGWSPGTAMRMAKRYSHIGKSIQREAIALLDPPPAKQLPSQPTPQQQAHDGPTLVTGPTTVQ